MVNPIETASRASRNMTKRLGGVSVTVTRGGSSFQATATLGETRFEHETAQGFVIETRKVDFLIDVSDYDFGSGATLPTVGDSIAATLNTDVVNFTVVPDESENAYHFHDRGTREVYRLHTVEG